MRLIFVNRFYSPETPATGQLLTDLAEAAAVDGHEVTVITGRPIDPLLDGQQEQNGVRIRRVRGTRSRSTRAPAKARDFATFYLGAAWRLLREARRGDLIVALTDPPLIGVAAAIVARIRGARLVHWVHDIYPEVAVAVSRQRWLRVLAPLRTRAWQAADMCVTLGHDMAEVLAAAGGRTKVTVIPNWAPAGLAPASAAETRALRTTWGLDAKFVIAYAGNLGRVHDFAPVLTLAEALRDDPRFAIALIGAGAQRVALQQSVAQRRLSNVTFLPPQPRARLAATLSAADVHLVTLRPDCERFVLPSKLYGIAAVERPMLFIGPNGSEVARTIHMHHLGHAAERDQVSDMIGYLRALVSGTGRQAPQAAREFAAAHSAAAGTARWLAMLRTLQAC